MNEAGWEQKLEELCHEVLGEWQLMHRHTTQRPGSRVLHVRTPNGREFVAKRHLTLQRYERETHAYTHWVPSLAKRAPQLIAAQPRVPAIIMTAIPGNPAGGGIAGSHQQRKEEAKYHRQAGQVLRDLHSTDSGPPLPGPASSLSQRLAHWLPRAQHVLTPDDFALIAQCTSNLADADILPLVPCHLDYQPRNWVLDESGVLRIVDFEHARLDIAIRDLVRLEFRHWRGRPDLREAFYDGYAAPINDQQQALLRGCGALDAVTALVRGQADNDPSLTSQGHATLGQLRHESVAGSRRRQLVPPAQKVERRSSTVFGQLESPDRVGRDLTLFRTRAYRFSDDPRYYVMAERAEEDFLAGLGPSSAALDQIRASLTQLRRHGRLPAFDPSSAAAAGLVLDLEMARRAPHLISRSGITRDPDLVVAIVGAPRSGTSHLVNILAQRQVFAYFTTASCWAWPVWNLDHPERRFFTEFGDSALAVDNKRTRIIPSLVMPAEAEDVYSRAIPVYRHISGHRYAIESAPPGDLRVLRVGVHAHLKHFGSTRFLTKSPFNSFRIPAFESLWGPRMRYIHITRSQQDSAASMKNSQFEYFVDDRLFSPLQAWSLFEETLATTLPPERTLKVTFDRLRRDPEDLTDFILNWLEFGAAAS